MSALCKTIFEDGYDIHPLFFQSDADTDITGDWVKMTHYERMYLLLHKAGSEDIDTMGAQILQATSNSGGSAKVVLTNRCWYKTGTMTGQGTWTAVTSATGADAWYFGSSAPSTGSYTPAAAVQVVADVDTAPLSLLVEILAENLDKNNGFNFVTAFLEGDYVNNAALFTAFMIMAGGKFPQAIPLSPLA